jgi:hypothetical protein
MPYAPVELRGRRSGVRSEESRGTAKAWLGDADFVAQRLGLVDSFAHGVMLGFDM